MSSSSNHFTQHRTNYPLDCFLGSALPYDVQLVVVGFLEDDIRYDIFVNHYINTPHKFNIFEGLREVLSYWYFLIKSRDLTKYDNMVKYAILSDIKTELKKNDSLKHALRIEFLKQAISCYNYDVVVFLVQYEPFDMSDLNKIFDYMFKDDIFKTQYEKEIQIKMIKVLFARNENILNRALKRLLTK